MSKNLVLPLAAVVLQMFEFVVLAIHVNACGLMHIERRSAAAGAARQDLGASSDAGKACACTLARALCFSTDSVEVHCMDISKDAKNRGRKLLMSSGPTETTARKSIKRLIATEILSRVDEWYEGTGPGVPGLLRKFGEAGLLGVPVSADPALPGAGGDGRLLLAEELGRIKCVSLVGALAVQAQFATRALAWHASTEVQNEFLAPAIAGQRLAGSWRPARGAPTRTASCTLRVRRVGGDYLLTGSGLRVANADPSGWICVSCEDPDAGSTAMPMRVVVPCSLPGVSILGPAVEGGHLPAYVSLVEFDAVRVPLRYAIRPESPKSDQDQRDEDRLFAAALYLSRIEEIIAVTGDYLASRRVRGGLAVSAQFLGIRLAEMQTEVACAHALIGNAAREKQAGSGGGTAVLMARCKVAQLSRTVPSLCLKIWGECAPRADNLISRMQGDMCLHALDGSTPEGLVREIARNLGFDAPAGPRNPAPSCGRSATRAGTFH